MNQSTHAYMQQLGQQARLSAKEIARAPAKLKSQALMIMADELLQRENELIDANHLDLEAGHKNNMAPSMLDRLTLNHKTIALMATGLQQIAEMPDPVGELSETRLRPNGMRISRMRVPLGVIGIIYESRPNVTIDATALCLKSGNACILRGGSEAIHSNTALASIIASSLKKATLPAHTVQVVKTTDRAAVGELVTMTEYIDVIIPRGGKSLIKRLREEARVPMINHLDGNCHLYIDEYADLDKAISIAVNAKTYRYGICGAMETLLIHQSVANQVIPQLIKAYTPFNIEFRCCERSQSMFPGAITASEEDWYTEFTAPILAVKIVNDLRQAIDHIQHYGSQHTDSIVTEYLPHAQLFQREVDSSSVYVNLPTCFSDGFEYGLGAEIGISTNKLHARGPVGLEGLTTYKWVLQGEGQLRGQP